MNIVLIGAGNVATSLALSLQCAKHNIIQIFSRNIEFAKELACKVDARFTDQLTDIVSDSELYICCLKDNVLESVISRLPRLDGIVVHTSGSMSIDIFKNSQQKRYGVFYPFMTFNKLVFIPFSQVPLFIEGNECDVVEELKCLSESLHSRYWHLPSDQRKWLHLAGVYSCNFTNYMFAKSEQILSEAGLSFEVILPLIKQTVQKTEKFHPFDVQSGPAMREDYNVIDYHINLLNTEEDRKIYSLLTQEIIKMKRKKL